MSTASIPLDASPVATQQASILRVAPAVGLVVAYWGFYAAIGLTEIEGFHKFLYRLGALAILLLGFTGWWLLRRSVPLAERLTALGAAIAAAVVTLSLRHPSIHGPLVMGVLTHSIEATVTGWTAWLAASRGWTSIARRRGMVMIAIIAWAWALAVRMDGLSGSAESVFHWRWTPSGEEQFLAEQNNAKVSPQPDTPSGGEPLVAGDSDWIGFRGPLRDGAVHGVEFASNWDKSPPKRLWKRRVGPGWSSLVVVGDRLFTQEQRGEKEAVVCFDANTGKPVWGHEDPGRFDEAMGGVGPRATPTFDDGRLYSLGATGILNCLDAATGELQWSQDVKRDGQNATPIWGFCSSPLIVDGKAIVFAGGGGTNPEQEDSKQSEERDSVATPANDKTLLAYDSATGALAWRVQAGSHSYSSAQLAEFHGVPQVLFIDDAALQAVEPATGKQLWSLPTNARREGAPAIQPHIVNDSEFLASFTPDAGLLRGIVTRKGDEWSVEVKWPSPSRDLKPFFSDFVRVDDALYGFDGSIFRCVDANTGKRNWKGGGRYGSGQVLLVADQPVLVVLSEKGEAVLVAADPEKHEELGRFQAIEGKTWNHPTIVRGRLYVRNADEMACYEL
jgi:outer membrane protein assembly factor BamB